MAVDSVLVFYREEIKNASIFTPIKLVSLWSLAISQVLIFVQYGSIIYYLPNKLFRIIFKVYTLI